MEKWKNIEGYEGIYQISNLGNVKNAKYNRLLTGTINKKSGYVTVMLSKNKIHKRLYIHRLVARAFIEDFKNDCVINHKNFIKNDNRVENLECCTQKENVYYSYKNGRLFDLPKTTPKKIIRNDGKKYMSIKEASEELKVNSGSICNQLKGRRKEVLGYTFSYIE